MLEWALIVIALLIFWVSLFLANRRHRLEKRGFTVAPGMLMWRTKRGLRFIDRVAKASKNGWRTFGTVAAVVGIFLMAFVFFGIARNAISVLRQPAQGIPGVRFVLPGAIPGLTILAWLVSIGSILLVHEFAHGFLLRAQGLKTKSVGGMLLVAIPGAFVEPDEKQLRRAPISERLRVFGAGSFANILFAFLCLGVLLLLLMPRAGVYVYGVAENNPAENLRPGMRIISIDNLQMNTSKDFHDFMDNTQPGQILEVKTEDGEFSITLTNWPKPGQILEVLIKDGEFSVKVMEPENENVGYMGVIAMSSFSRGEFVNPRFVLRAVMTELTGHRVFHPLIYEARVPWGVIDVIKWMFVLNLGVGLFNLLPAVPLDGGYIAQGMIERASSKRTAKRLSYALSLVVLVLILLNFAPTLCQMFG